MARRQSAERLVMGLAVAWFALWACAPPSMVAPMVPMADPKGWDLGGALSAGATVTSGDVYDSGLGDTGAIEYVVVGRERYAEPALGGQVWSLYDAGRVTLGGTLGGTGVISEGVTVFGGFVVRPTLLERDNVMVGLDAQLGWYWASLGVPVSVRATDRVWVYTDPSIGARLTGLVNVPLGVSVELSEKARFNAEVDYWTGANLIGMGYLEGGTVLGTVGVSYRP